MAEPSEVWVRVVDDEIVVTLPHSTYIAIYEMGADSPHLTMKHLTQEKDPQATLTIAEFLGRAWDAANAKARELGWIA
jgi:hypothetical protein